MNDSALRLVDDLLRRELRIGDPKNPASVAQALTQRYPDMAARLSQESAGLPVAGGASLVTLPTVVGRATPGNKEYDRVSTNLTNDLQVLVDHPANREWRPELVGWRTTLNREIYEGAAAARLAQDPGQRERAWLGVRRLADYARICRLVGVLHLELCKPYRRLATTLDECASVIRILMGEALYEVGLADGGLILQVPIMDMRARRDGLIAALRWLDGREAPPEDFADSANRISSYTSLLAILPSRGASDLGSYVRESTLVFALDFIIDDMAASTGRRDADGLRQLSSTVPVEVARLQRLLRLVGSVRSQANSNALQSFEQSLDLFLQGFVPSRSSARLIDLSVPLPMAAQQSDESDGPARQILRDLVSLRAEYAREIECYLGKCGCGDCELECQVKLDKVLSDIDQAICLYAQGQGAPPNWGDEERRAWVLGHIAANLARDARCIPQVERFPLSAKAAHAALDLVEATKEVERFYEVGAGMPTTTLVVDGNSEWYAKVLAAAEAHACGGAIDDSLLAALASPPDAVSGLVTQGLNGATGVSGAIQAVEGILLAVKDSSWPSVTPFTPTEVFVGTLGVPAFQTTFAGSFPGSSDASAAIIAGMSQAASALSHLAGQVLSIQNGTAVTQAGMDGLRLAAGDAKDAADDALALSQDVRYIDPNAVTLINERAALVAAAGPAYAAAEAAQAWYQAFVLNMSQNALRRSEPLLNLLSRVESLTLPAMPVSSNEQANRKIDVFQEQLEAEGEWIFLVRSMAPRCLRRMDLVEAGRELLHGSFAYKVPYVRPRATSPSPGPAAAMAAGFSGVLGATRDVSRKIPDSLRDVSNLTAAGAALEVVERANAGKDVDPDILRMATGTLMSLFPNRGVPDTSPETGERVGVGAGEQMGGGAEAPSQGVAAPGTGAGLAPSTATATPPMLYSAAEGHALLALVSCVSEGCWAWRSTAYPPGDDDTDERDRPGAISRLVEPLGEATEHLVENIQDLSHRQQLNRFLDLCKGARANLAAAIHDLSYAWIEHLTLEEGLYARRAILPFTDKPLVQLVPPSMRQEFNGLFEALHGTGEKLHTRVLHREQVATKLCTWIEENTSPTSAR